MRRWLWVTLSGALLLVGCAGTVPRSGEGEDASARWLERRHALQAMEDWQLTGRISVTDGIDSWTGRLEWQESPGGYDIRLSAPLGQGHLRLVGSDAGVVLNTGDALEYANDPGDLLYAHTGVQMPVTEMRWWIRGLPGPEYRDGADLDAQGRLEELVEAGWTVDFRGYTDVAEMQLPRRVFIHKGDVKVRVVIDRWHLPESESAHARLAP